MDQEKKRRLYKQLGVFAALKHSPVLQSVHGLVVLGHQFKSKILEYAKMHSISDPAMCMEVWAAVVLQKAFKRSKDHRLGNALRVLQSACQKLELSWPDIHSACRHEWQKTMVGAHASFPISKDKEALRISPSVDLTQVMCHVKEDMNIVVSGMCAAVAKQLNLPCKVFKCMEFEQKNS